MASTIYGLDWIYGYGVVDAYTSVADAELAVYYNLLERHMTEIAHSGRDKNQKVFEAKVNTLANDVEALHDNLHIEDVVYITNISLNDTFKP